MKMMTCKMMDVSIGSNTLERHAVVKTCILHNSDHPKEGHLTTEIDTHPWWSLVHTFLPKMMHHISFCVFEYLGRQVR